MASSTTPGNRRLLPFNTPISKKMEKLLDFSPNYTLR